MDTIEHVLREKGNAVHTISPKASVLDAVDKMCEHRVGSVLVCDDDEKPVGIFSERDLMTRVILERHDPAKVKISAVMTAEVVVVDPSTSAQEAMALMTEERCRHLPVVDGNRIAGMISIGDLVRWISRNLKFEVRMLTDYISGKYPG